ncbi:hypothetical protein SAMN04487912_105262 [Arthrobacter sp. cf158]|nr:hypothetical protein SAMN04487912_105262 [Arthrobacter sp. cf158]
MRCRHRTSKLLLRQAIVYFGGRAWVAAEGGVPGRTKAMPNPNFIAVTFAGDRQLVQ